VTKIAERAVMGVADGKEERRKAREEEESIGRGERGTRGEE
jgi:hypothetical protein